MITQISDDGYLDEESGSQTGVPGPVAAAGTARPGKF